MNFATLLGSSRWSVSLFYISAGILCGLIAMTLFAIINHRFLYRALRRSRYVPGYTPRCSIIIPCKGTPKDLRENLESFIRMDYPSYEVIFTVESEADTAVPVIKEVIAQAPDRATLVVAGYARQCAQKNYNQLAALKAASSPEVLVFADADIGPSGTWLRELVLPLSDPKITATTGFRWQLTRTGAIGEQVHAYLNNLLYVMFNFSATVLHVGMWGGSMAMRKKDFDQLDVAGRWATTAVDDMSLSRLIQKARRKSLLVPTCVTVTDDALQTVRQSVNWFMRQVMFLKGYHLATWIFLAIPLASLLLLLYLWLPVALTVSRFSRQGFFELGGGASLLFVVGSMALVLPCQLMGRSPRVLRSIMLQPLSLVSLLISVEKTLFTNTIIWSGIKYTMNFKGVVKKVEHLESPAKKAA